jgi:hypothetical protein
MLLKPREGGYVVLDEGAGTAAMEMVPVIIPYLSTADRMVYPVVFPGE